MLIITYVQIDGWHKFENRSSCGNLRCYELKCKHTFCHLR